MKKTYLAIEKQIEVIGKTDFKAEFQKNLKGKRCPHYDNRLVAIMVGMNPVITQMSTLKGQMTRNGRDGKRIADLFANFLIWKAAKVLVVSR